MFFYRTKGSGWGGGPLLYQVCPVCGRKKCIYDPIEGTCGYKPFRCLWCKDEDGNQTRSDSDTLLRVYYAEQLKNIK